MPDMFTSIWQNIYNVVIRYEGTLNMCYIRPIGNTTLQNHSSFEFGGLLKLQTIFSLVISSISSNKMRSL